MKLQFGDDNIRPVPLLARNLTIWGTISIWLVANLVVPTIMTGQMFIPDLNPLDAISAIFWGSALGCIALALTAVMGTRTGMPTMALSRPSFGSIGSKIPSLVNTIILCGWSFIQAYLGALSLNYITKAWFGIDNLFLAIIVTQGFVWAVTILGHVGIQQLEKVVAVAMLIFSFIVFYVLFKNYSIASLQTLEVSVEPGITYAVAFDIVLATAFSWMSLPPDYNRYCKTDRDSALGISIGYLIGTIIAMGLGVAVGALTILNNLEPSYDPTVLLERSGYGVIASVVLLLSVLTTNIMALYSAVMSALNVFTKISFVKITFALGLITVAGAFLKEILMQNFFDWILLVGTLFIPIFAVMLSDFYIIHKGKYDVSEILLKGNNGKYSFPQGINYIAVITYIAGAIFSYYFTYVNPLATGATIWTFVFTSILYVIATKLLSKKTNLKTK